MSVELRDTEWPSYLQATRYSRNGWNISIEYEYAAEVPVKGRADFGNAVVTLGELVPGTYTIEARLFRMDDSSVAARVVRQQLVVRPLRGGGMGQGSRSSFYTGVAGDCAYLKALEIEQRAASEAGGTAFLGWSYEGVAFYALLPEGGKCAAGTHAVYRSYNGRGGEGDANHRFTADPRQRGAMAMSWIDEGPAFCSPAS